MLSGKADLLEEVSPRSIEVGISVDNIDNDGWTLLMWVTSVMEVRCYEDGDVIALKMVEVLLAGAANISVRSEAVQHQRDRSTKMTMIKMISALMTRLLVMTTVMSVWRRGVTRGFEGWDTC